VDELRADLAGTIERSRRLEQAAAARDSVLEKLLSLVDVPLPEAAVAEELESRRESIREQLTYVGMTEEQYLESEGQTKEEFEADLHKRVRDALAAQFVLDELAKKEQLSVDEAELTEHLVRRAQRSGLAPDDYAKQVVEGGHVPMLVSEVVRGKALAHIVDAATVRDASGRPVELKRLQPDGSIVDESDVDGGTAAPADETEPGSAEGADSDSAEVGEREVEGAADSR
jgi:trigger factor